VDNGALVFRDSGRKSRGINAPGPYFGFEEGLPSHFSSMATVDSQPKPVNEPQVTSSPSKLSGVKAAVGRIKRRATTKEGWVGDYDYSWYVLLIAFSTRNPV
jgi:hypothetical protein